MISKARVERLEKAVNPREVNIVIAYQSPGRDCMRISNFDFEGNIEEGKTVMRNHPANLYVLFDDSD